MLPRRIYTAAKITVLAAFFVTGIATARMPFALLDNTQQSREAVFTSTAEVTVVLDGDTLRIRGFEKDLRIGSIDAPETGHGKARPGQPYARAALDRVNQLLGRAPRLVTVSCYSIDRYGRNVCDVTTARGENIGQTLVAEGLAWANRANQGRYLRDRNMVRLEEGARAARAGLWGDSTQPTPPWEWRHQCWDGGICAPQKSR